MYFFSAFTLGNLAKNYQMPVLTSSQITTLERNAGRKAARTLKNSFKSKASSVFNRLSGDLVKNTTAKPRVKKGRLQRIAIESTQYGFIQHHGFNTKKKNGVSQRLKATYWMGEAMQSSKAVETLADEISAIRGEEIMASTKALENGRK